MPHAVITVVRHGETDWNVAKIIQGHLDTPLNENGIAQARVAARYLRSQYEFDEAYASDLKRAAVTGQVIVEQQKGATPLNLLIDPRIRERFLGELQGKVVTKVDDRVKLAPTIEPYAVIVKRLFSFWDAILPPDTPAETTTPSSSLPDTSSQELPRQILVVSHGGAIRALIQALLQDRGDDYVLDLGDKDEEALVVRRDKRLGNCSITQVVVEKSDRTNGRWQGRIVKYADDSYFADSSRVPSPSQNADVID